MEFTCIMCPVGCTLNVTKVNNEIKVTGNGCPRGEAYGKDEITLPKRMITTVKQYKKGTLSLKTSESVDKNKVEDVLKEVANFKITTKIKNGDILIKNVLNTGVDIVVTNVND